MSTRDYFCSVTSIAPIRAIVGLNDDILVNALIERYTARYSAHDLDDEVVLEDIQERRSWAESMINCETPPEKEPGCWHYFVEDLAHYLGLDPNSDLPFNEGWKHYYTWKPYRKLVEAHISQQSMKCLGHLESGRPLRGREIDHDGCVFAWLSESEVKNLYESLFSLENTVITDEWADFHETLVASLITISGQSKELFMGAC